MPPNVIDYTGPLQTSNRILLDWLIYPLEQFLIQLLVAPPRKETVPLKRKWTAFLLSLNMETQFPLALLPGRQFVQTKVPLPGRRKWIITPRLIVSVPKRQPTWPTEIGIVANLLQLLNTVPPLLNDRATPPIFCQRLLTPWRSGLPHYTWSWVPSFTSAPPKKTTFLPFTVVGNDSPEAYVSYISKNACTDKWICPV